VRERTTELAVLKAVGFNDWTIVALLMCESLVLCFAAAAIGMGVAEGVLWLASGRIPIDARLELPRTVVLLGMGLALILSLATSLLPARRGLKLRIAAALAGR
jgi:putative ABC transport system permease protein